jgi:hypothetical protein
MKAVSYTVLFAILSPGLLLLVPSVFKAVLKNPLSLLAIVLNVALFYMALTNIKYIPYLNTLEGFQDTVAMTGTNSQTQNDSPSPNSKLSEECKKCTDKSLLFSAISVCEKYCLTATNPAECAKCHKDNVPNLIKKHCSDICTAGEITEILNFSKAPSN